MANTSTNVEQPTTGYDATKIGGKSIYDIQREKIASDAEKQRQSQQEALKRRLAATGLDDSGIALKQSRDIDVKSAQEQGTQDSAIDTAELGASETKAATEKQYEQQNILQTKQITSTERLASNQISSNEKLAADSNLIAKLGLTLQQAQLQGYTDANGNHVMGSLELSAKGLTLQQAEDQGYTDANGNHIMGKSELAQQGLTLDQAKLYGYKDPVTGQHVPGSAEIQTQTLTQDLTKARLSSDTQIKLQSMVDDAAAGRMTLQQALDEKTSMDKTRATAFYNAGASGAEVDKSIIDPASPSYDPIAADAYNSGKTNIPWQQYTIKLQNSEQWIATSIASLNPKDPDLQKKISDIINSQGGTAGTMTPTSTYEAPPDATWNSYINGIIKMAAGSGSKLAGNLPTS